VKKLFLTLGLTLSLYGSMSIQEAWKSLESNNNGIKASLDDERIAQNKKSSATSMYLPAITVVGSYTHLSDPIKVEDQFKGPITGNIYPFEVDLSQKDVFLADLNMLWPLYTGGKIDAAQMIYSAKSDEAKAKSEMKKDEEFLKLVKYYYGAVVAQALYETRLQSKKALLLHYKNAQKLKENGQIAKIELLNAKVKLDGATTQTLKAKHKYEIALSALSHLVEQKITPSSPLFVNGVEKEEEYYKLQTEQNYAGLDILLAKEKQSQALVKIKKAAWHPEVVGYANYNLYKDDSILSKSLPQWFAGVVVKINLLQREDRGEEIEIAKLTNAKVKHLYKEALQNLSLLVEKTYKEMEAAQEEYFSLDSSLELAEQNYHLREISFQEGLSTSVELVDAQMFLLGAKTKKLNAAYEYVQKLSQLCVLSGEREMFFKLMQESGEKDER